MTIRTRLGLGFLAVAVILVLPLIVALRALERLQDETIALRDNEFAASLLLGRMRSDTDELRQAETVLLLFPNDTTRGRMSDALDTLSRLTDSLAHYQLDSAARSIRNAVQEVAQHLPVEYEDALAKRTADAERTSEERMIPAITRIERTLARAEGSLRQRTIRRVEETANAGGAARQLSAVSLMLAALLAGAIAVGLTRGAIAVGLTRSVSHPVRDLERGMAAVASGDFAHRLSIGRRGGDEFGRLAQSFETMSRQLAELDKLKAEFVSVASHELKTPLNVVIGYLQLFDEGVYGPLTPKQREICRTLESQAQALSRLVKQLLDVSRFDAGGGRIDARPMHLGRFLDDLERAFDVLARQRGIAFRVVRGAELPTEVLWDEDRMNEVMGNLISNAFKFTERDGTVELTADGSSEVVQIEVRDTGAGITAQELPFVFEKFFQAGNQAQAAQKGTGLGLAIAKQIVEAHGGMITAESTRGVGTTFSLTLPVAPPAGARTIMPERAMAESAS
jgi:signal transduction histidine kinase